MIGGIYCEVSLKPIFYEKTIVSINQQALQIYGKRIKESEPITQQIVSIIRHDLSRKMGRILSSWSVPGNRYYYNRTVDLTRSICFGIYVKGKLRTMYRFTGGKAEKDPPLDWVSGKSPNFDKKHIPGPEQRAQSFLSQYQTIDKNGICVVFAATMPYAVRLEKEYKLPVLSMVINRMIDPLMGFNNKQLYGYIFSSGETE